MLDVLQRIDTSLFFTINNGLSNSFFDWLMPFITTKQNWYPLFLIIIVGLLWKGGKKGRIAVLLLIPVIVLSDQISASLIKPLVDRMRPCEAFESLGTVHMLIGMKTSASFPSSHAANSFAAAAFFAYFYPRWQWSYFTIAALIAFSRVYVGVHYPFDVFAGALLGVACAYIVIFPYKWIAHHKMNVNSEKLDN